MFSACKRVLFAGLIAALSLPVMLHGQLPPEGKELVRCNNEFAFQLYRQLRKTEGNLFFSPYSISCALSMAAAGARGETEIQMRKTLCFPDSLDSDTAFGQLTSYLGKIKRNGTLKLDVANSLWVAQGIPVRKEYLESLKKNYSGIIFPADFSGNPEGVRSTINQWVERQTRDKIKEMIPAGGIDNTTNLCLINAVYFFGAWKKPFDVKDTKAELFTVSPQKKVTVPMMYQKNAFNYAEIPGVKILAVQYSGSVISMLVILPDSPEKLAEIEEKINEEMIAMFIDRFQAKKLRLYFPKFMMENDIDLKSLLMDMGMKTPFSSVADFSGINGSKNIFFSKALHKTFVNVDEKGTEAAAATAIYDTIEEQPEFRADHPFIFLIRDRTNGSILFMGRVVNPPANIR